MHKKYHTVYLTVIGVLVVALGWSLIFRQYESPDVEPLPKVVIFPFFGAHVASIRLTDGVIHELEGSPAVKVELPSDFTPPDVWAEVGALNFRHFFGDHKDSLVLSGTVSGTDENLRVTIIVFDNRPNGQIWSDQFIANIYDLDYLPEEIAGQVVSIASR